MRATSCVRVRDISPSTIPISARPEGRVLRQAQDERRPGIPADTQIGITRLGHRRGADSERHTGTRGERLHAGRAPSPGDLVRGEGTRVWDDTGKEYLDFVAGIAVVSLGHADPQLADVIAKQAHTLITVSNIFYTEPQIELAELLVRHRR